MAAINPPLINFSGGILGKLLWGRVDVPSYANSAEIMENWRPNAQGVMTRRPSLIYVDSFDDDDLKGYMFPFVYASNGVSLDCMVLASEGGFVFYEPGGRLITDSVTATIAEGTFATTHSDLADGSSITASSTAAGATANLVDESVSTYWQAGGGATATLTFDLGAAYALYDIWLSSHTSTFARTPTAFTLSGSATGSFAGEETTVLTISGESNWVASEKRKYRITTPTSYRYYRLTMTNTQSGAASYSLSEVSLYDSPWLDNSAGNAVVTITGGKLYLDSDGATAAVAEQKITINDTSSTHVLVFDIDHGPVSMRIGTTTGDNDLLEIVDLGTGHHRIGFDPDGNSAVYLQFYHSGNAGRIIDNVSVLSGTAYSLPHPYAEGDLPQVQYHQIGNVMYLTHPDYETRKLRRYGSTAWSLEYNRVRNGPFDTPNLTPTTIAASDTSGEVTLTASDDLFESTDPGQLFAMTDSGQLKTTSASSADVYTDGIKVTGSGGSARTFNIQVSGTFTATVTLQESSGNENNYTDTATSYTAAANVNYDDNKDNETWYYRLGVKSGDYTSGTVTMTLTYTGGSSTGIVRIISVTDARSATAEVIDPLASTDAVKTWKRSVWNEQSGWPSAVTGGYGRLWFGAGITVWASVSDDFTNFEEGSDADQAFSVTLSQESSEGMRWLNFVGSLVIGTRTAEKIGTGNTSSEPVGPTNFQTVPSSEEGSAAIQTVRSEASILFVHRSLKKLMQFTQAPNALSKESFTSIDLTELAPELLDDEVVKIAIQREPQRRVFVVLKSGRVGELLFRREIEVTAWNMIKTQGRVEDVCVIQQEDEDRVYFVVRRRINGTWKRFVERYDSENVFTDFDLYHLDSALSRDLTRPDTVIECSGTSGTITVTADDAAFSAGDVGKRIWFPEGRGLVASYTSSTVITVTVTTDLDPITGTNPIPSGKWGLASEVSSVTGADHLEGETVRIFGDMIDLGTAVVSSGTVTLPQACSIVRIGLPYTSRWKSLKLAYGAQKGTALGMKKKITQFAAVLVYRTGPTLKFGRNFDEMFTFDTRNLDEERGYTVPWGEPVPLYTGELNGEPFDTEIRNDPRICFVVDDPHPATLVGAVPAMATVDL